MNKHFLLVVLLVVSPNLLTFAQNNSWVSLGFEYGNYLETATIEGSTVDSYCGSPGISASSYIFWNRSPVGLFLHSSLLFPSTMEATIDGTTSDVDLDIYDFIIQYNLLIGPGFHVDFSDRALLHTGIGFHFVMMAAEYTIDTEYYDSFYFNTTSYSYGLGGDIGLKINLTNRFCIDGGIILSYDLKTYTEVTTSVGSASDWSGSGYKMIAFNPYISAGFTF